MDIEKARFNMIEQQIRPWQVLDEHILQLLAHIKREVFLPPHLRSLAFVDTDLPWVEGVSILSPKMEARMLEAVAVKKEETVLVSGVQTGYMLALLAHCAKKVVGVESSDFIIDCAKENMSREGFYPCVTIEKGEPLLGCEKYAPYDVIIVTQSLRVPPEKLKQQLKPGGRLLVILGQSPVMTVSLIRHEGRHIFSSKALFETDIQPFKNAPFVSEFVF